jgi:hypothetical protein
VWLEAAAGQFDDWDNSPLILDDLELVAEVLSDANNESAQCG